MKKRNDKEYIKQMQKQIVDLKKYIVKLENKLEIYNFVEDFNLLKYLDSFEKYNKEYDNVLNDYYNLAIKNYKEENKKIILKKEKRLSELVLIISYLSKKATKNTKKR